MVEWLPDKRWVEFAYHKFYNPEVEYDKWKSWDEWDYPECDVHRFKHIIADQLDYIKNKRVLDIACHLGYTSLFCLHNGASHVTGTNVRQRELDIAKEICTGAGYTNFNFLFSNLYDTNQLQDLCNQHDTILCTGILYLVNNHFQFLEAICTSTAETIIIETKVPTNDYENNCEEPLLIWRTRETKSPDAWYYDKPTAFYGTPNTAWIVEALDNLNMHVSYVNTIEYDYSKDENIRDDVTRRVTITATRK